MKRVIGVGLLVVVAGCSKRASPPMGEASAEPMPLQQAKAEPAQAPTRTPDVVFVPTPEERIHAMLKLAQVGPKDTLYDLGCGDGRIAIIAARDYGARAVGVDIDPVRVREARENVRQAGLADRVEIRQADLFETDFSDASVVTLYLLPSLNQKLRPKLQSNLRPGSRIVSHAFDMGEWKPDAEVQVTGEKIYLWRVRD